MINDNGTSLSGEDLDIRRLDAGLLQVERVMTYGDNSVLCEGSGEVRI